MVSVAKHHAEEDICSFVGKHHRDAIKKWLELRAIFFLDVSNPTRPAGATDNLQSIVYLPASSLITALRSSGLDGVFVRPFIESDQDRMIYRAAPLPMDVSLESAVRQAYFFGEKAYGVVPFACGFAVRVNTVDYQ